MKKIYLSKSKLHGKGIFAKKDIKKGEIIFIIKGKIVNFLINNEKQADKAGWNWFGLERNKWLDPTNEAVFLNHSCHPNSFIKGKVNLVASYDVKKGEEITFDYSTTESDIFWHIKCNCGAKDCRKVIRSIQFLPEKTFNKYLLHIPKYFQKIYKKFNQSKYKDFESLKDAWIGFIKKDYSI